MAEIIDGRAVAAAVEARVKSDADEFFARRGRRPGLAVVLVGEDPASKIYVRNKIAACGRTGIKSSAFYLDADADENALAQLIDALNADPATDGILVQLPLPPHIGERAALSRISPQKDVDGFHVQNAGALMLGGDCLAACTPSGCIELIKSTGVPMTGKRAVVAGRSNIVGKPAALLLLREDCTVTVCHSKTENLPEITRSADILIAAIGKKEFFSGDMIKPGAIVIDVGMNRADGKLYGDVNFAEAEKVAAFITPVPGGVGPMTIAMLLKNTLKAADAEANASRDTDCVRRGG